MWLQIHPSKKKKPIYSLKLLEIKNYKSGCLSLRGSPLSPSRPQHQQLPLDHPSSFFLFSPALVSRFILPHSPCALPYAGTSFLLIVHKTGLLILPCKRIELVGGFLRNFDMYVGFCKKNLSKLPSSVHCVTPKSQLLSGLTWNTCVNSLLRTFLCICSISHHWNQITAYAPAHTPKIELSYRSKYHWNLHSFQVSVSVHVWYSGHALSSQHCRPSDMPIKPNLIVWNTLALTN